MKKIIIFYISLSAAILMMMQEAFINGYPLVYSDTSTYIVSGFELETPFDRPITYGLWLRLFSFNGFSLWGAIAAQCGLLVFLIFKFYKHFFAEKYILYGLITIFLLSFGTGLSWVASQLIADIFTPIALLSLLLIIVENKKNYSLYLIFLVAMAMHLSHILLFGLLIMTLLILKKWILKSDYFSKSYQKLAVCMLLVVGSMLAMGGAMSKSRHVFFMGAMVEHGILKTYLEEYCNQRDYKICAYKDSLPARAYQFIWEENSPFYKMGAWAATKTEFNQIINHTFKEPKYIYLHVKASLYATFQQLFLFKIGDGNGVFLKNTVLYERVERYFPQELKQYERSRQNLNKYQNLDNYNYFYQLFILLSVLVFSGLFFVQYKKISAQDFFIIWFLLFFVLLNAWSCATFANAIDRLGCKVIWFLPFLSLFLVFNYLKNKKSNL